MRARARRAVPVATNRGGAVSTDRYAGRVAIVTGGGGGLGREYALLIASGGGRVVVNDLGGDQHGGREGGAAPAEGVVSEIRAAGGEAVADTSDVAAEPGAVVRTAVGTWGRLDLVVNNAGIAGGGSIDEIAPKDFDRMIDVHYRGTVGVCRAAWPVLREGGYGRIVNTSSGSTMGLPGSSAYISAKAAVMGLTRALAFDGAPYGIKVNAVMPIALTRLTRQIPSARFRDFLDAHFPPSAVAPFVGALLAEGVPCSGETFSVGGGIAARVVLATVPGFVAAEPQVEDYLANFDQVMATEEMWVPAGSMDEVEFRARQLGVELRSPTFDEG
jgi:NAD(P)-dependent dehydrogenase (short-subunit alcohol dehydrogenase family)